MAKVFRWRYAWRRTGRQAHFGECTVVEQVEVHEDGSTEVVGFEVRGAGSASTWLYGADKVALLNELIAKRRERNRVSVGLRSGRDETQSELSVTQTQQRARPRAGLLN